MRSLLGSSLVAALLSLAASAQSPAKPANAFPNEAGVLERNETIYRMHADGTGERDIHVIIRVQSEGVAKQFSVLSFAYASASETPKIAFVRVHKPDGTTVETPAADAIDMSAAVTREAPLYSDLKEKHLPVRSLSVGDTLEYELDTLIDRPEAPGQFWGANHFNAPGSIITLADMLTLEVPKDKYVQVWSPNHKPVITEHDNLRTYTWNVAQLVPAPKTSNDDDSAPPAPKDPDQDAEGRTIPSVAWTTFKSWAEVGDWYRSLADTRAQPSDALRARAEELTRDAKTPDQQVQAIYAFVSTHTRYVGIDFGVGRYQPHLAADVLANQYGDCKDKDTLLEALLRAKGFTTAPALIGVGIATIPEVPSPAVFNHVITTVNLPTGRIWLDSTPELAPYRMLIAAIRDQQALVVPPGAPAALERTPALPPFPLFERFEANGVLDEEGKFTSHMVATYRSDDEIIVRTLARSIAPAEWDKASQYISSNTGFGGTTSHTTFTKPDDLATPIVMTYDYARHPYGDWDNRRIDPAFPALGFTIFAAGAKPPTTDIELGAPRTLTAVNRIKLPAGWHTDLPDPIHIKTPFVTFDKTYRFDGKEIVIERNVTLLKDKWPKADWKSYETFTKDASLDGEIWIQLIRPETTTASANSTSLPKGKGKVGSTSQVVTLQVSPDDAKPVPTDTPTTDQELTAKSIPALMELAQQQMQASDWKGASATLDVVKSKNSNEKFLWSSYGILAGMEGKNEEAQADFVKELNAYPDNESVVYSLARMENNTGDSIGARKTLQAYLDTHPESSNASIYLASLQTTARDDKGALKTLETASSKNPDDRNLKLELSNAFLRLNRKDEAMATAKSAMDGSDDASLLNNGSYVLAEIGLDLPLAEEMSRKSIRALEEKSAAITTAEVNSNAFGHSDTLIASWDTLGWILFREDKFAEARAWIAPSWRNALRPEVGDHLGQIYEAMNQPAEALQAYRRAQTAISGSNVAPDVHTHITDSITRLSAAKTADLHDTGAQALQDSRTYKIPRPAGASGWGTFRLQIDTSGVVGAQQMTGEQKLAATLPAINAMKFPELIPPQSRAHLLRSAIVSCSTNATCELVLVPNGSLRTEQE